MTWQPIETAPLDGTMILLWLPDAFDTSSALGYCPTRKTNVVIGWSENDWGGRRWECTFMEDGAADSYGFSSQFYMSVDPTHWMPLPEPPVQS